MDGYSGFESMSIPGSVESIDERRFQETPNLCKIGVSAENTFLS